MKPLRETKAGSVRVLFVCMGNICRSPTAEGVFKHLVKAARLESVIEVDSAGTHAYHVDEPPDPRSQAEARRHGVDLSGQRARQVTAEDFDAFDYIIAMDEENYRNLAAQCPPSMRGRIHRLCDFADGCGVRSVPDPYYGGRDGFGKVYALIESGARGLLAHIRETELNHVGTGTKGD